MSTPKITVASVISGLITRATTMNDAAMSVYGRVKLISRDEVVAHFSEKSAARRFTG